MMVFKGPGVSGIVEIHSASALALKRAADILVAEFSYDGEDPNGVKAYQHDADYFRELAAALTDDEWVAARQCK